MRNNNYISNVAANCMLVVHGGFSFWVKGVFLLFILFTIPESVVKAADHYIGEKEVTPFVYDEIPVHVIVEGYNNFYVDAIYTNTKVLYVNIEDLFKTINIPCLAGPKGNTIGGFIENESQTYLIDYDTKKIIIGARTINSGNGLVKEMGALYMESSLFAEAFGILLNFNYRTLSITLKSNFELPVIKQQRIEKMRSNISNLKGEGIADTVLQRNYHMFKFGTIDWLVASSQTLKGFNDNHFGLGVGTELLYGEADVSLNYYNQQKFDNRQLQYLWRWVDNNNPVIKQAQVGKISSQSISFINAPVIGAVIRNSPTTVRKATGYYTINDFTEPNWTVELYINNVLVDYTRADASGSYIFKVPIVYGYTTLKLRFYGPLGEERTVERTMNVPYTVMPANEFEYGLTAGIVQDSSRSRFGKGEFNYGVNRMLTVGGGLEYLSSIPNGPFIPYAKATVQPFSKLTLNAEYAYGVKSRGLLDYYFSKDVLLEIDYTKYVTGQLATRFNAPEERKIKLSVPIRYKKMSGFVKFDYTQLVYNEFIYNQGNLMFSAYYKQISANSSVQLNWIDQKTPFVTTNLALSYRLKSGIVIRPSAQFNVSEGNFMMYKAEIEKRISKGLFSVSYERNVAYNDNFININFKYDLPFARTNASVSHSKGKVTTSESAQGSLAFGGGNQYTHVSNNSSVGKGGILLYPFLDLNQNGIFDKGEHMVYLNKVKINGGRAIFSEKDSIIRIPDLNAFTGYMVEFNDNDLETIAWRFIKTRYQVLVDPNQFKRVDIPVMPVGEVSGMAYRKNDNSLKGIGRILVKLYNKNDHKKVVAATLSESDGYIYYLGLEPGEYIARVDSIQLSNLGLKADPSEMSFTIKTISRGDIVSGIDFVLRSQQDETLNNLNTTPGIPVSANKEKRVLLQTGSPASLERKDTLTTVKQENLHTDLTPDLAEQISMIKDSMVIVSADTIYRVQLLALRHPVKDKSYFSQLQAHVPGLTITETKGEDGLYHYSTQAFRGISESSDLQRTIRKSGWKDSFVAIYAGERRTEKMFRLRREKSGIASGAKIPAKKILPQGPIKGVESETEAAKAKKDILYFRAHEIVESGLVMRLEERILAVKDTSVYMQGDTTYKVQLLALHTPIKIDNYFALLLSRMPGLKISETYGEDDLYHYSAGVFSSIKAARAFNMVIREHGWVDSFVTSHFSPWKKP